MLKTIEAVNSAVNGFYWFSNRIHSDSKVSLLYQKYFRTDF